MLLLEQITQKQFVVFHINQQIDWCTKIKTVERTRMRDSVNQENIKIFHKIVSTDRKIIKVRVIVETITILIGSGQFYMRKLLQRRVPPLLTINQKQFTDGSNRCFDLFKRSLRYFTLDKTSIVHHFLELNRSSVDDWK